MSISKSRTSKPLLTFLSYLLALVLAGCSSGGDDMPSTTPPTTEEPPVSTTGTTTTGFVELGLVKDATVEIETLDGHVLYSTMTKSDGSYSVDIDALKTQVNQYDNNIQLVRIISAGGTDTDPDDNGVSVAADEKYVAGNVKGIIPLSLIYSQNGYRINLLTTAIAGTIEKAENIDQEYVEYAAEKIGVYDLDKDGDITIADIVFYDMVNNDSDLEKTLRESYLGYIHEGNQDGQETYLNQVKAEIGLAKPTIQAFDGHHTVILTKTDPNNTLQYGISNSTHSLKLQTYGGQELTLYPGDALVYEECNINGECHKPQKMFAYENEFSLEYAFESSPNMSFLDDTLTKLADLRSTLERLQTENQTYQERIEKLQAEKALLDEEVAKI